MIDDFPNLLKRVLQGEEQAICEWHLFAQESALKEEHIEIALKEINSIFANSNHPHKSDALFLEAFIYRFYFKKEQNYIEVLLDEAIRLNNPNAMYERARNLYSYQQTQGTPNYSEVIRFLLEAIDLEHCGSMAFLACMYRLGVGVPVNYPAAARLLNKAIQLSPKNFLVQGLRGEMYQRGEGEEIDYEQAIIFYETARELGDPVLFNIDEHKQFAGRLKKLKEIDELKVLYAHIKNMSDYGKELELLNPKKGELVQELALNLQNTLTQFLINALNCPPTSKKVEKFKDDFSLLLHSHDFSMRAHREIWKPIVINISIALTGIGSLLLLGRIINNAMSFKPMSFNEWGFFAKTKTQASLEQIENEAAWSSLNNLNYNIPN